MNEVKEVRATPWSTILAAFEDREPTGSIHTEFQYPAACMLRRFAGAARRDGLTFNRIHTETFVLGLIATAVRDVLSTASVSGASQLHRWVFALLDVRPGGGGHLPPATDAGSAVVSDNQSQPLKRLKFPQDGPLTRAVPGTDSQVYLPGVQVAVPFGDDGQELHLPVGEGSVTHDGSPGWKRPASEIP